MNGIYKRQKELKLDTNQSITVCGAGGIGYWVCKFAAMSGIETIYCFDDDTLEEHNLNRLDLPLKFLGRNKADIVKVVINNLRPQCTVYSMPWRFNDTSDTETDWLIDCTDNYKSQVENQKLAQQFGMKYMKAGYDGLHITISDKVAMWGDDVDDGYQTVPSWVVPATIVAAMTVAKIMKYNNKETSCFIKDLYK